MYMYADLRFSDVATNFIGFEFRVVQIQHLPSNPSLLVPSLQLLVFYEAHVL